MARADHPAHFLGFRDRRNNKFAGRPFPTRRVCDRAPRWRQPAGRPLGNTLPTLSPFHLRLRSHLYVPHRGPRIPPGQRATTSIRRAPTNYICQFFNLELRFPMPRLRGNSPGNLDAGEIFTFRLPLSECDACGLLRAPHSTRQAPIKSPKWMQGRHENEKLQALKQS